MFQAAYADSVADSPSEARARERDAIAKSIEMMTEAAKAGPQSREAVIALNFLRQLWTILIEDLGSSTNALPPMLRAQLISIGISVLRQAEDIRMERKSDFSGLIEISKLIIEGLK